MLSYMLPQHCNTKMWHGDCFSQHFNCSLHTMSCYMCVCNSAFSLYSSGVELVNALALLLLFLLNLLLVGRQERLKRTEMVRRLKGIIMQLSGESGLSTHPWKCRKIKAFELLVQSNLNYSVSLRHSTACSAFFARLTRKDFGNIDLQLLK